MRKIFIIFSFSLLFAFSACQESKQNKKTDLIVGKWKIIKTSVNNKESLFLGEKHYLELDANKTYRILNGNLVSEQGFWERNQNYLVTWINQGQATFSLQIELLSKTDLVLQSKIDQQQIKTFYERVGK